MLGMTWIPRRSQGDGEAGRVEGVAPQEVAAVGRRPAILASPSPCVPRVSGTSCALAQVPGIENPPVPLDLERATKRTFPETWLWARLAARGMAACG